MKKNTLQKIKNALSWVYTLSASLTLSTLVYITHVQRNPYGGTPLTEGEKKLAQSIFGDTFDFSDVRKIKSISPIFSKNVVSTTTPKVISFWDKTYFADDFSTANRVYTGIFLHEMTHIVQKRQNYTETKNHHGSYVYDLQDPHKTWKDFDAEQQAEIIRAYFFRFYPPVIPTPLPTTRSNTEQRLITLVEKAFPTATQTRLKWEAQQTHDAEKAFTPKGKPASDIISKSGLIQKLRAEKTAPKIN